MKKNLKTKLAIIFGALHLISLIAGFFIFDTESGSFLIFYIASPLLFIVSLFRNKPLGFPNFASLVVFGTLIYVFFGYCVGLLIEITWGLLEKITREKKIKLAIMFGIAHFVIVGLPLIFTGGVANNYILIIDLPLVVIYPLGVFLLGRVLFNFILFVIFGTIMYSFLGYGIGSLIGKNQKRKTM